MGKQIINKIKSMILRLCKNQDWNWKGHIESTVKYSKILARRLKADEEVCEISAWLHDIRKLKGKDRNHHLFGSKDAVAILNGLRYKEEKIKKIEHCVLTHSSDKKYPPTTKEAKCLASADALSHFFNFLDMAYVAYKLNGLNIRDGRRWLVKKYKRSWDKMMPEAKKIAAPQYRIIRSLLK